MKPIYLRQGDVVGRETKIEIVGNNEQGEKNRCPGFVPVGQEGPLGGLKSIFTQ